MGDLVKRVTEENHKREALTEQIVEAVAEGRYLTWQLKQLDDLVFDSQVNGNRAAPFNPSLLFIVVSHEAVEIDWLLHSLGTEYDVHKVANMDLDVPDTILVSESSQHVQAEKYLESILAKAICFECAQINPTAIVIGLKEALIVSRTEVFMKVVRPKIIYASRRNVAKVNEYSKSSPATPIPPQLFGFLIENAPNRLLLSWPSNDTGTNAKMISAEAKRVSPFTHRSSSNSFAMLKSWNFLGNHGCLRWKTRCKCWQPTMRMLPLIVKGRNGACRTFWGA